MTLSRRILVVDDERVARESLAAWLREDGHAVDAAGSGTEAIALAKANDYAVCFIDLRMPNGPDGIETMRRVKAVRPDASVVIVTAFAAVDTAVEAMKGGAEDYLVKPFNPQEISLLVERILHVRRIQRENALLRRRLSRQYSFEDLVSRNPKMLEIFSLIRQTASLRSTVLVLGESGTGKELVARALHSAGERREGPFVAVSCAALSDSLLESELFGHEKGAFTGATARKRGKFEMADGGTLFLDEIGDIPEKLQLDLLRVLQERSFFRLGGSEELSVDVRVVAATNRDLATAVEEGDFRRDLYYRLNVITIRIPPLRERLEDIPLLAETFRDRFAVELSKEITGIDEDALAVLMRYDWPGNVRELENAIERAMVTCPADRLGVSDFGFVTELADRRTSWNPPTDVPLIDVEKQVIAAVLRRTGGNVKEAANVLGIDRSTLYDKMKRYATPRP